MSAKFPDVPVFPGVPSVFRGLENPPSKSAPVAPLQKDDLPDSGASVAKWGLYDKGGKLVLEPDSIFAVEPTREARVMDHPVEEGGFRSYNKVMTPSEIRVTMTKGGSDGDRQAFLEALETLIRSLDLFSVIAPDSIFLDRNLTRYDYKRTSANGAALLTVELVTLEIRQTVKSTFSDSKKPSGANPVNNGPVQPKALDFTDEPIQFKTATPAEVASQVLPTTATPSQKMTTTLAGQTTRIEVFQKAFGLFADVYKNDNLVIGGVRALSDVGLVQSKYLDFAGELAVHAMHGKDDPSFETLGSQFQLLYAKAQA